MLLAEPLEEPDRRPVEPLAPLVEPALAAERRPGRQRVHPDHAHRVLAELADRHAAADVVDVVGVAVVRGVHRDDRPEVRRSELRDLDRGEPAVRDPPHPDVPVRPGLAGEPLDRLGPVLRLARGVLVEGDAGTAAGAPDVEPAEGVAAGGEPPAAALVAGPAPVVLAVRDQLEDRREPLVGRLRGRGRAATGWRSARGRRSSGSGRRAGSPRRGAAPRRAAARGASPRV